MIVLQFLLKFTFFLLIDPFNMSLENKVLVMFHEPM